MPESDFGLEMFSIEPRCPVARFQRNQADSLVLASRQQENRTADLLFLPGDLIAGFVCLGEGGG